MQTIHATIERKQAAATARASGAVGAGALVPRFVRTMGLPLSARILDFGCGRAHAHVHAMQSAGWGNTQGLDYADADYDHRLWVAQNHKFAVVYLSNVLNVQGSEQALADTLCDAWMCVAPGGTLVFNVPTTPRKGAFDGLTRAEGDSLVVWMIECIAKGQVSRHKVGSGYVYTITKE
jgi:hypothetical protein